MVASLALGTITIVLFAAVVCASNEKQEKGMLCYLLSVKLGLYCTAEAIAS